MLSQNCIILPCYNEETRLQSNEFLTFANNHKNFNLLFVNDGSTDKTLDVLLQLEQGSSGNIKVLDLKQNQGKAEAVRQGFIQAHEFFTFHTIGFLDSDLATSLPEYHRLTSFISNDTELVLGSRIKLLGNHIERKKYRHYLGRIFATIVGLIINESVYDTQCGAKVFHKDLSALAFDKPFLSPWFFDVEILARLKKSRPSIPLDHYVKEVPLVAWKDVAGSKIKAMTYFRALRDLYLIKRRYT